MVRQVVELGKVQQKGAWLRNQEVQENYIQRESFFVLKEF